MDAYPCNLVGITTYLLSLPSPCETNLGSTNSGRGPINQLEQQTQFYYIYGICALYKYAPQNNKQKQKTTQKENKQETNEKGLLKTQR